MLRHVEREFHASGFHLRPARAEKARLKRSMERLLPGLVNVFGRGQLTAQRGNQLRRERVAARFAGDYHYLPRPHGLRIGGAFALFGNRARSGSTNSALAWTDISRSDE